jgi:chorismate mutase
MPRQNTAARARLERLRTRIDAVDAQIIELLGRRARLAKLAMAARAEVVGAFRVRDRAREAKLLAAWKRNGKRAGLGPASIGQALSLVLSVSRRRP